MDGQGYGEFLACPLTMSEWFGLLLTSLINSGNYMVMMRGRAVIAIMGGRAMGIGGVGNECIWRQG